MNRGVAIAVLLVFAGFVAYVVVSASAERAVRCEVCVTFKGLDNCATASATSEQEAARSAQSTACATISGGVTDGIACDKTPPRQRSCGPDR